MSQVHICNYENEDSGFACTKHAWNCLKYTDEQGDEYFGEYCDEHAEELKAAGWEEQQ